MVSADMDLNQAEVFLTSQMKKPEGGITENQANALRKFWKNQKNKIHEAVISKSTWNNTLHNVSWRIDIKSQARHLEDINTPTAIMELQIGPNDKNEKVCLKYVFNISLNNYVQFTNVNFVLKIKLICCQKVVHDDVHYQHLLCEFR